MVAVYTKGAGKIDAHNHMRQGELKLEKQWVTHSWWTRIFSTVVGICVVDAWLCWKLIKHDDTLPLSDFVEKLVFELIPKQGSLESDSDVGDSDSNSNSNSDGESNSSNSTGAKSNRTTNKKTIKQEYDSPHVLVHTEVIGCMTDHAGLGEKEIQAISMPGVRGETWDPKHKIYI